MRTKEDCEKLILEHDLNNLKQILSLLEETWKQNLEIVEQVKKQIDLILNKEKC